MGNLSYLQMERENKFNKLDGFLNKVVCLQSLQLQNIYLLGHDLLDFKCCCKIELCFLMILTYSNFRNIHSSVL